MILAYCATYYHLFNMIQLTLLKDQEAGIVLSADTDFAPYEERLQKSGLFRRRITEYRKLSVQNKTGSSCAVEYPMPYREGERLEPCYPVLTERSHAQYEMYRRLAERIPNLVCCGRLADFKYYNMDQALERAFNTCSAHF